MPIARGTQGYERRVDDFDRATNAIGFFELHCDFQPFLPKAPARVLDVGAGCGRDAAVLASLGHDVVAVEPLPAFLAVARSRFASSKVTWLDDSLPALSHLVVDGQPFDFILASGVWHHIDDTEREIAMGRLYDLLAECGHFAVSLRHGPAGLGTHCFPTDAAATIEMAEAMGLKTRLHLAEQPSLLPGKEKVVWARLLFQKPAG